MERNYHIEVGKRIRNAREAAKMSQEELANRVCKPIYRCVVRAQVPSLAPKQRNGSNDLFKPFFFYLCGFAVHRGSTICGNVFQLKALLLAFFETKMLMKC